MELSLWSRKSWQYVVLLVLVVSIPALLKVSCWTPTHFHARRHTLSIFMIIWYYLCAYSKPFYRFRMSEAVEKHEFICAQRTSSRIIVSLETCQVQHWRYGGCGSRAQLSGCREHYAYTSITCYSCVPQWSSVEKIGIGPVRDAATVKSHGCLSIQLSLVAVSAFLCICAAGCWPGIRVFQTRTHRRSSTSLPGTYLIFYRCSTLWSLGSHGHIQSPRWSTSLSVVFWNRQLVGKTDEHAKLQGLWDHFTRLCSLQGPWWKDSIISSLQTAR